jgi:hypothetical protein
MKIIKSYMEKVSIEEAKLKDRFFINGVEFAVAKNSSKHYPFRAYHYASGQPVGVHYQKLLRDVKPNLEKELFRVFNQPERWQKFLDLIAHQEIINLN